MTTASVFVTGRNNSDLYRKALEAAASLWNCHYDHGFWYVGPAVSFSHRLEVLGDVVAYRAEDFQEHGRPPVPMWEARIIVGSVRT